jgi:hypothetical protein
MKFTENKVHMVQSAFRQWCKLKKPGSGRTPYRLTPAMDRHLRAFVELMRGKPPRKCSPFESDSDSDDESDESDEGIDWESRHDPSREWRAKVALGGNEPVGVGEIEVVDLTDDVEELTRQQYEAEVSKRGLEEHKSKRNPESSYIVLIKHLVWQLEIVFPEEYNRNKDRYKDLYGSWYHVVYRWTQRNGLRVKKVNRENVQDRKRKAVEMLVLRREVQNYVRDNKVRPDQLLNMDEVGLRAFCLVLKTLHWAADTRGTQQCSAQKRTNTGDKGPKKSKLCLSMPLLWKADGSSEVVVVWHRKKKVVEKRWTKICGVWWYAAPTSKWTTQQMYPEIVRHFCSLGEPVVYIDDMAPGHGGNAPECWLSTVGGVRFRIPPGCTGFSPVVSAKKHIFYSKRLVHSTRRPSSSKQKV